MKTETPITSTTADILEQLVRLARENRIAWDTINPASCTGKVGDVFISMCWPVNYGFIQLTVQNGNHRESRWVFELGEIFFAQKIYKLALELVRSYEHVWQKHDTAEKERRMQEQSSVEKNLKGVLENIR